MFFFLFFFWIIIIVIIISFPFKIPSDAADKSGKMIKDFMWLLYFILGEGVGDKGLSCLLVCNANGEVGWGFTTWCS